MSKVNHVLGISGGKDSAALSIYMSQHYPELDVEYYTCDTGKELDETYALIDKLNSVLGKNIRLYKSKDQEHSPIANPFDHFLATYRGYLPSPMSRWCTKKMKLEPFENEIGTSPTISYVGIRGDEHREGYISKKENIQTIFPFRKNIWSEDVIKKFLDNSNIAKLLQVLDQLKVDPENSFRARAQEEVSFSYSRNQKLQTLLNLDVRLFNWSVFEFLKGTDYPVGKLDSFPLIENDDVVVLQDVFDILEKSGVGIPAYYLPVEFEVEIDGKIEKGTYSRSRSGCFFCFYQQKIEWVWLLEQHPNLYEKAIEYEKEGYTWMDESLEDLRKAERVEQIKRDYVIKTKRSQQKKAAKLSWQDEILKAEGEGCASCFI